MPDPAATASLSKIQLSIREIWLPRSRHRHPSAPFLVPSSEIHRKPRIHLWRVHGMRAEELDGGGLPARLAWGHERRGVAFGGRVSTVAGGGVDIGGLTVGLSGSTRRA